MRNRRQGGAGIRRANFRHAASLDDTTPLTISNLWSWRRGDTYVVTGSGVSEWTDKSTNGRHMSQGTDANRPTTTTLNGKPALRFDGANFYLNEDTSSMGSMSTCEIFVVAKHDDDPAAAAGEAGWWDYGITGAATLKVNTDSAIYDGFGSTTRTFTGNPSADLSQPHLYNVITASGEWTSNINGTQHFTTATNAVSWEVTSRFGVGDGNANFFKGECAEIIIYSAKLSSDDRDTIEAYISKRYGITIS